LTVIWLPLWVTVPFQDWERVDWLRSTTAVHEVTGVALVFFRVTSAQYPVVQSDWSLRVASTPFADRGAALVPVLVSD
jgi:hypothetical protein